MKEVSGKKKNKELITQTANFHITAQIFSHRLRVVRESPNNPRSQVSYLSVYTDGAAAFALRIS